jgi:hypothetical protein
LRPRAIWSSPGGLGPSGGREAARAALPGTVPGGRPQQWGHVRDERRDCPPRLRGGGPRRRRRDPRIPRPPDVKWHGGDPSFPGACHNSDDVVAVIREARRRGGIGELVDVVDAGDQVVAIMRPPGTGEDDTRLRANVTTFRDGRVFEMVAYESPDEALATVRRR